MIQIAVLMLALIGLAGNAGAAGFRLSEQDAKATGMANAFVAVADDAAAAWYNPAATVDLDGMNLSMGSVMVLPAMEHKKTNGTIERIDQKIHTPPHFYATQKLNNKAAVALSINTPFGLSTSWDKLSSATKYVATKSEVVAFNYNLNGAYKVTDKLSAAAGVSYVTVNATLDRMITPTIPANLKGDGHGMGYNAALMYKHNDQWNFGMSYRSKVKTDLEGDLITTTSKPVKTTLTLPDTMQVGAAYKYTSAWLFSAEADYTDWTTYRAITLKNRNTGAIEANDIKNWKSVWAFRLGTEYKINEAWKFRSGVFYDMNPVQQKYYETRVPDSDRIGMAIGGGYTHGNITVDASYLYLKFMNRHISDSTKDGSTDVLNGEYSCSAGLPAITVSYKF